MPRDPNAPPIRKSVLILGSVIFALILGEILMRLFLPIEYQRRNYNRGIDIFHCLPGTHRFDPEIGFTTEPHLDYVYETADFRSRIRTNSSGFRDDEESMRDPQVVFLGDSFGFGWGVQDDETCASVFEEITGILSLNLAITGTGTIQQYLLLKRFAEPLGLRGKTVVFLFFANDFSGNASPIEGLFPTFRKKGRELSITPTTEVAFETWLAPAPYRTLRTLGKYSYTLEHLVSFLVRAERRERMEFWRKNYPLDRSMGEPIPEFESFEYILKWIRTFGQEWDLRILMVYIPEVEFYERGDHEDVYPVFEEFTSQLGFATLDLRAIVDREDYYLRDLHWAPSGHRKAAQAIAEFFEDRDWFGGGEADEESVVGLPREVETSR
jgi:hypothetical protein